ncbi:MAG TPA: tetraacyldisaccharide 4'-kinase [Candidatus Acidoferrales bacterium]|nr:tetraacyldisaccharide 4'-kinase [Candidatus Acidoferrales bacterium]
MTPPRAWLRLLWPVSVIFSGIVRAKAWCYRRGFFHGRKLPGTVISVGNLTVGGTGKTPVVMAVAEHLAGEGKHTAILTRGYRGITDSESGGMPQSDEVACFASD